MSSINKENCLPSKILTPTCSILHELDTRLRVKCKTLLSPRLDTNYFQARLSTISGVKKVRINVPAASVIVDYSGLPEHRVAILHFVSNIPKEAYGEQKKEKREIAPSEVISKSLIALTSYWQPPAVKKTLSLMLGIPTIFKGISTLYSKGLKVEVLDASAVLFSLMRSDYATANTIVALLGIGSWLEQWTDQKSNDLLKKLLKPQVTTVWVERDKLEIAISFKDLVQGDIVICGTGELLPIDGTVISGEADLNLSSVTGESLPVHVSEGDDVISGAIIEDGRLHIRATKVGQETSMARISHFLETSLRNPSETQKQSEKLADKLVPITFGLGLGIFALTRDIRRAASVLTVDYSCAIKLVAPVTVKSGMYSAAKKGVLFKGGQALDCLAKIDTLVFDKTGTLTKGNLEIVDIIPLEFTKDCANDCTEENAKKKTAKKKTGRFTKEELLSLTAGAEEHYGHPVARSIVAEAKKRNLPFPEVSQVDFIVAHGVSAFVNGDQILVGSRHFIEDDEKVDCSKANGFDTNLQLEGKSVLYIARKGQLIGIMSLQDELRAEVASTLAGLRERGIKHIVMLTGDHENTAKAIASKIDNIDTIHWGLKPEDKARIVKEKQAAGQLLAFVGDGVNDAPALLSADVGICMPSGADLAKGAAKVVLLEEDLSTLITARDIAVQNQKVLKESFYATVGINSFVLLLAITNKISPITSALLHNAATVGILAYAVTAASAETILKNEQACTRNILE